MPVSSLRSIEWLSDLAPDDWAALSAATRHVYGAGDTIFSPTPDPHSIYLLERGQVRILRLSNGGDEVTLGYVANGEVFGELPGFGDHPRESFAVARSHSIVWKIPLRVFRRLVSTQPKIAMEITRQMGDRMKRVESRVEHLVFGDVRARLATVLVELARDFGQASEDRHVIDIALSQGELATLIGSTRQSVNAAMSALKEEGLIRRVDRLTEILDLEGLRRIGSARG